MLVSLMQAFDSQQSCTHPLRPLATKTSKYLNTWKKLKGQRAHILELSFSMMIRDASRRWRRLLVGLYCNSLPKSPQPTPCIQPRLLLVVALFLKPRQFQPTEARLRMGSTRGRRKNNKIYVGRP